MQSVQNLSMLMFTYLCSCLHYSEIIAGLLNLSQTKIVKIVITLDIKTMFTSYIVY